MIPTYVLYSNMGILGTLWSFILPSILGMGINGPIFILIFYQFFKQVPKVLIEAAQIDGAGYLKSFIRISLPSAIPAIITVTLFSFVWYWNETYLLSMYVGPQAATLPRQLASFQASYAEFIKTQGGGSDSIQTAINEAIYMSGTLITILPLLLLYFVLQQFKVRIWQISRIWR